MKTTVDVQTSVQGTVELIRRSVTLRGVNPIMFDRYAGDNQTQLEPQQKMYYLEDLKTLCLPSANISSFLSGENTVSAPRRLFGKRFKDIAQACLSFVSIEPFLIPSEREADHLQRL